MNVFILLISKDIHCIKLAIEGGRYICKIHKEENRISRKYVHLSNIFEVNKKDLCISGEINAKQRDAYHDLECIH